MEILALDVGAARVGVARGSTSARLAEPLKTITADEALSKLTELIGQTRAEAIVVGLPRNLSGEDTNQTSWVRSWVMHAQSKINLPFYWQDEALTSHKAESHAYRQAGLKPKAKQSGDVDSMAAAIILQDFLDSPEDQWVMCYPSGERWTS